MALTLVAVIVAAVLFTVLTAVLALRIANVWRTRRSYPSCGRCGYDVTGAVEMRCPECGAPFTDVGIIPAQAGDQRRRRILIVACAVLALLSAGGMTSLIAYQQAKAARAQAVQARLQAAIAAQQAQQAKANAAAAAAAADANEPGTRSNSP